MDLLEIPHHVVLILAAYREWIRLKFNRLIYIVLTRSPPIILEDVYTFIFQLRRQEVEKLGGLSSDASTDEWDYPLL